jgi:hypothetical protein
MNRPKKQTILPAELKPELITVRELADLVKCHSKTVYQLIESFQLPGLTLARTPSPEEDEAASESQPAEPASAQT